MKIIDNKVNISLHTQLKVTADKFYDLAGIILFVSLK